MWVFPSSSPGPAPPLFPISIRMVLLSLLSPLPSVTAVGCSVGSSFRAPSEFFAGLLYRWDRASWGAPPVNRAHFTSLSGQTSKHRDSWDFLRSYGTCFVGFFCGRRPKNLPLFCRSITRELFGLTSIVIVPTALQPCLARGSPLLQFVGSPRNTTKILLFLAERKEKKRPRGRCWWRHLQGRGFSRAPKAQSCFSGFPLPGKDHFGVDAAASDAGQQLWVPLLLRGLLRGEVLQQKFQEVFACLTPTRQ